jgi:hypothetical protein
LFQSAIMNRASLMHWFFDYDNKSDHGDFGSAISGNSTILLGGFASLYQDITGEPDHSVYTMLGGSSGLADRIAAEVGRRHDVPVLFAGFAGWPNFHWLTVEKVNYGADGKPANVYLRNPWGAADDGSGSPPRWLLPEGGGRIGMKWSDFVSDLEGAVVPNGT